MGYGDKLMAIGDALDLYRNDQRGLKVAIGNGQTVEWCELSEGLPFLADQALVDSGEAVNWVISYASHRPYINYAVMRQQADRMGHKGVKQRHVAGILNRYVWNTHYRAKPAEVSFSPEQQAITDAWSAEPFVCIEPFTKARAPVNKQWPVDRYTAVARRLARDIKVVQISPPDQPSNIIGAERVTPESFKEALAYIKAAKLYIGPEGGLHHGAAAVGTPAVVLFGGYISPKTTGYDTHINLTGGVQRPCGERGPCPHCTLAMEQITAKEVADSARKLLKS